MKVRLDIPLNPKQVEMYNLLNSGKFTEILFYGASRSGKTFLILFWMIVQAIVYNANSLVVRETFTSLNMGMIRQTLPRVLDAIARLNGKKTYQKLMVGGKPFAKYNGKDNVLTLFNGAYIQFASIRAGADGAGDTYDKILSTDWGHIFADEVSEIDFAAIETLYSRLAQLLPVPNIILYALNPTTELHWTYKRFFKHENMDGSPLSEAIISLMYAMHFSKDDNLQFVSKQYFQGLDRLSTLSRARFRDGEYSKIGTGKYFRQFTWLYRPHIDQIVECVIYTDPSAKSKETNDFKATVTLVRTVDTRIWLWDCRAVQGTSHQMLENIYELAMKAPLTPRIIIEKKQLPLDFEKTLQRFQIDNRWTAPICWDTLNHGDKFSCIESTLEPLVNTGKFVFCNELQKCGVYEHIIDQFVRFSDTKTSDRKDDIPDACAKGVTFLNHNIVQQSRTDGAQVLFYRRGTLTQIPS